MHSVNLLNVQLGTSGTLSRVSDIQPALVNNALSVLITVGAQPDIGTSGLAVAGSAVDQGLPQLTESLSRRFRDLERLEKNWDSYGAPRLSPYTVALTKMYVRLGL